MRTDDLEQALGGRIRALRIGQRLTQVELADRANVSVGALQHLESGAGSTTTTLVKVLRALDQERWIETLGPGPAPFNPLDLLESRQQPRRKPSRPSRVRHRRTPAP
jgi:transcriptional regulator with XRE-family HTH domain